MDAASNFHHGKLGAPALRHKEVPYTGVTPPGPHTPPPFQGGGGGERRRRRRAVVLLLNVKVGAPALRHKEVP